MIRYRESFQSSRFSRNFEARRSEFFFVYRASIPRVAIAMLTSLQKTYTCRGAHRFTHSIVPARLSVCKPYIQLNWSSSRGGGYPRRWCHCARAVGSGSGSAWLNEKLSGLYIYIYIYTYIYMWPPRRTRYAKLAHKLNFSWREFVFYGIKSHPSRREENVWRDVWGLRSFHSRDWQMKISSWSSGNGLRQRIVIAKLAPVFVTGKQD